MPTGTCRVTAARRLARSAGWLHCRRCRRAL